ncbi:MAG: RluA family pseudouridine synthase [Candidatus Kerfeldbacteria bacterium]|nr:RluA family pseudouridine synthase [Candidatus Kerfeldbacteria bacterium]
MTTLANSAIPLSVIAETPDYIVLNKAAGIVVHQAEQHLEPDTIANGLLARYPELADVGEDPLRPGIIHRLDQHVSGVLLVARTQAMFLHLKEQWQQHLVRKQYIALVHGKMSRTDGEINFSIARSSQQFTKMAARPDASGKAAVTRYNVLKQYQRYALLDVEILTGRTHQIRVHMSAIDHPIVGEQVYLPKNFKSRLQPGRLFLHAASLSFGLPDGTIVGYSAPLPDDLQAILDGLH